MKNLSKIVVLLVLISNIENIYSNWLSDYFFKKDTTDGQSFESFYFSEIDPLSQENIEKYKKLLKVEDCENFLNNKLKQLYSLYKNNPEIVSPETLRNIIKKIQEAYQDVTPSSHILFYPALEQFVMYPNYKDSRRKKTIFQELEDIADNKNKKCNDLYVKAQNACKEIIKQAQMECKNLNDNLSRIKKEKLNEFKESPLNTETSIHTAVHPHPIHLPPKAKDKEDNTKEDTSNIFKDMQDIKNVKNTDIPEMKDIPRL